MNFTREVLGTILGRAAVRPRFFVETGTQRGRTTLMVDESGYFDWIYTCDRSDYFAGPCREAFRNRQITYTIEDSRAMLRRVPAEACFFYLDAHWDRTCGGGASFDDMPLWDELALLAARQTDDIVVVDDVRVFGAGLAETGTDLWGDVSVNRILKVLKLATWSVHGDQLACYRLTPG